jgi:hypothetical protein
LSEMSPWGFASSSGNCTEYPGSLSRTPAESSQPSCCLQDRQQWVLTAKPRQRRSLGPEPSSCLQDRAVAGADRVGVAESGSARLIACAPPGTVASIRGDRRAICGRSRGKPGGTRNQKPASACGCRHAGAAGRLAASTRLAGDGIGRAGTAGRNNGSAAQSSL